MEGTIFNNGFIDANKSFWNGIKESDTQELLLVETSRHPVINHANAIVGKIVARAKGLRVAWLKYKFTDEGLMRSYSANSIFLEPEEFSAFFKLLLLLRCVYYYISYAILGRNLHSFKYNGIAYGDFVYDGYLANYSMATMHKFDLRMIAVFYNLILRDEQARILLSENNIKAALVSHHTGFNTGILTRVALQRKIPVYWKGGGHEVFDLSLFKELEKIYDYPLKPNLEEMVYMLNNFNKKVEADFNEFINQVNNPYFGAFSCGYNNNLASDISREKFLEMLCFKDRLNIFVMLHSFNDFPHSHFKSMVFNDFYDWFVQTYKFALKDTTKNWIFKEHPEGKYYPTRDFDLAKMMRDLPPHVKFVPHDSVIKASTVLNVADFVITCLGSAGVEMPALKGIPSIIASNTFFDGYEFTIEPKTKEEYFETLKNLSHQRLSPEQQKKAKCCYLYLKKYISLPFSAGPAITYMESKEVDKLKENYADRILACYNNKAGQIYKEFEAYVKEVKRKDFFKLTALPS